MFVAADIGGQGRGPHDDFWYYPVGNMTAAGVRVSPQTALAVTTMFACALVMGQTMGMLPAHLYRRKDRGQARATDHPLYRLIHRQPNRWQTAFQWRQMMQWHLMLRYNAYSEILFDRRGNVAELIPVHPDRVVVERMNGADGVVNFRYRVKPAGGGAERVLVRGEMFHVRGLTSDGVEGFSPLDAQSESIGEALQAQSYTSRNLKNDARPGGVLEWEGHFKDDEEARKFRQSWQEAQAGANRGKTAVLQKGMTWKEVGTKNTDLQLVELRKLKGYDIAAMNRMPPHKVGLMERATFTNIEHQGIEFATDTVQPWCVNWEQELSQQLLLPGEQEELYFEFNMNALLRGDAKTRAEFYGKRFQTGSLSPNDIRALENENPVAGGDRYFVPVNMVPADRVDDVVNKGGNKDSAPGSGGSEDKSSARAERIERATAKTVLRKEVAIVRAAQKRHVADPNAFIDELREFYRAHADFVSEKMVVDPRIAAAYCQAQLEELIAATDQEIAEGVERISPTLEAWESGRADELACLARGEGLRIVVRPVVSVRNDITAQAGETRLHATLHRAPLERTVTERDVEGLVVKTVEREIEEPNR